MAKDYTKNEDANKIPFSGRLDPDLFKRLMDFCKEYKKVRNGVIEQALDEYLTRENKKRKSEKK